MSIIVVGTESIAANRAVKAALSDPLVFIAAADRLTVDAEHELSEALARHPEALVYADAEKLAPELQPETLLSRPNVGTPVAMSRALFDRLGRFRPQARRALLHDLVLRASERAPLVRLGKALRIPADDPALDFAAHRAVVSSALRRRDVGARVQRGAVAGTLRIRPTIPPHARVAIVLAPSAHSALWQQTLAERTAFRRHELIIDADPAHAARTAHADQLLFLSPGAQPKDSDWIAALLEWAACPEIGAVGGAASAVVANVVSVTGSFMIGREKLRCAGGFGSGDLADLCRRLTALGLRNLATPYAFRPSH